MKRAFIVLALVGLFAGAASAQTPQRTNSQTLQWNGTAWESAPGLLTGTPGAPGAWRGRSPGEGELAWHSTWFTPDLQGW